jgi:hypothetical protein
MRLRPCELSEASAFITRLHRHHRKPVGHRFSLKAVEGDKTIGVVVVGRPVARHQQDGETVEITRLCTDGTRNACSFLIGAAKRAARALGYRRMISYTLDSEPGASWRAAGMEQAGMVTGGKGWSRDNDKRPVMPLFGVSKNDDHPLGDKRRWEIHL